MARQQQITIVSRAALLLVMLLPAHAAPEPLAVVSLSGEYRQIPKQVTLILEDSRVVASNIRLGRMDPVALEPEESVERTAEANAVLVVITNQRLLGYGSVIGWREIARETGEPVESVTVEDFAAFVTTGFRYLNFNAATGIWASAPRGPR